MGDMALALPAAPPTARDEEADTKRFYELVFFLKDAGVCGLCSTGMAIAAVERENGERFEPLRACSRKLGCGEKSCEAIGRGVWKDRPRVFGK